MSGDQKPIGLGVEAPQCQFFVLRKKRLCRMTVKPGRRFCGEHEPEPRSDAGETDKRVPCPNDPKHTCYASKLERHLKICNARRTEQPAYIVTNINAPDTLETCERKPLSAIPEDRLIKLIDKINHLYAKHLEDHIKEEPLQPIHPAVLPEYSQPERAQSSRRHLRQASALLWVAERAGLVRDGTCYVELGAGKGQLSYYAGHAWCGARAGRVLAVDRAPLRHKRDNKLRSEPLSRSRLGAGRRTTKPGTDSSGHRSELADANVTICSDNVAEIEAPVNHHSDKVMSIDNGDDCATTPNSNRARDDKHGETEKVPDDSECVCGGGGGAAETAGMATRLRAELAHLALDAVPAVAASARVVGLAKHLCGAATDFALRCVAGARAARGVVLATCCHHRCARAHYVGVAQLQELGIDAEEFNMMLGVVSWATCGSGRGRARPAAPASPPCPRRREREAAGRRAKALLDWGRVLWLRERGFEARLCYYVPRSESLENVCIVAKKIAEND